MFLYHFTIFTVEYWIGFISGFFMFGSGSLVRFLDSLYLVLSECVGVTHSNIPGTLNIMLEY